MKLKIDENLPVEIAHDLRALGHDALTAVDQEIGGIDDLRLMARVEEESRIFMTMDKGIANIQAYSPGRFAGLILFGPNQAGRGEVLSFVRKRLTQILEIELKGRLVVVSETGIRIR